MSQTTEQQLNVPRAQPTAPEPTAGTATEQRPSGMARVKRFVKQPSVGGTIAGAVTLGLAATVGVLEAAVAGGIAYGVYRILRPRKREQ